MKEINHGTHHHVATMSFYLKIFVTLIVLTILTAVCDYINLGRFNLIVAMIIAITKAMFVVLFFMHLKWSDKLTWAFAGSSLFFLALLIGITFDDYSMRYKEPGWAHYHGKPVNTAIHGHAASAEAGAATSQPHE